MQNQVYFQSKHLLTRHHPLSITILWQVLNNPQNIPLFHSNFHHHIPHMQQLIYLRKLQYIQKACSHYKKIQFWHLNNCQDNH